MDSRAPAPILTSAEPALLPGWLLPRGKNLSHTDAAFAAGIALKSLDDLVRSDPAWAGCWRSRQALACAVGAARFLGRREDEAAIRDAVLLTAPGDDPGPAGNAFWAFKKLGTRKPAVSTRVVKELADLLNVWWCDDLAAVADHADVTLQSGSAAPFAVAAFVSAVLATRSDEEPLAWALADALIAIRLNWEQPVPLLMAERYGPAFRTPERRGRGRPGDPEFGRSVCLAIVHGTDRALRSARAMARGADLLLTVAPKVRTKGADVVIKALLDGGRTRFA
ncbi:hypothetical protein HDIA_P0100 (plasmid) [Hartmannibacter diazotrophicus]|uniref:Uncharacterized protein n=1 Tax=Hartmannibacter diazotrophicus TaxID=1482074 RepID=A0A2C9DE61_9HYPH|nr:DUF1403 family protein [Hartmannibacter diazotrophicus]SON58509.1 hypothetical protein HDIA_P0100 [Hartmannibacter diazotrophicus]